MSRITRLTVHRGFGRSLGNMMELFGGATANPSGEWIEVQKVAPGTYHIVANSMTVEGDWVTDNTALGFCGWDQEVENLDVGARRSDAASCFGMSEQLRWNDVRFNLFDEPGQITAPTVARLRAALEHVVFCAWCAGDV
jgi:hypothetical protein